MCIYSIHHASHTPTQAHVFSNFSQASLSETDSSLSPQQAWLRKFGYLSQASRQMSTMQSAQILSKAISDMQRFYGLEVTGEMDPATVT